MRFGTDGWRGIIADDFTFANVSRCAQGVCDYLNSLGTAGQGLVIGYDTRFLSKEFAESVAKTSAANGVKTFLANHPAPTPVVSYNVLHHKAAGAAILTASHNPAIWNGFKFKPDYAGSATQEITDDLEAAIESTGQPQSMALEMARHEGLVTDFDPDPPYLERLNRLVDLDLIRQAGLEILVDAMFGAGAGYLSKILRGGATRVQEMNSQINPSFPGIAQPEPIAQNLAGLLQRVSEEHASVGLALDGDADRLGVVDETGRFITTLEVFSLLALYMLQVQGRRGALVKGVTSSMMLNKLGQQFGVDVHEMKVGFKYIGPKMSQVDALMGGEESGGFAFQGHIPERDGILSALYFLEYMARTGKTPTELIDGLFAQVGAYYYHRRDVEFKADDRARIEGLLASETLDQLAGMPVRGSDQIDGRRLTFDNAWLASRFSGTEPLLRIYAEAGSPEQLTALLDAAQEYLGV
ncbi:MAG: phosphomannomutase [SAR202 cluster bacterium Io17-Chloro-G9]|nr:MAG: phosphomannomutase [SAR202 cluster bacterium Io17-Chloro-G9]